MMILIIPRSLTMDSYYPKGSSPSSSSSSSLYRWLVGIRVSSSLAVALVAVPTELRELADRWTGRLRTLDALRDWLGPDMAVRLEVLAAASPSAELFLADAAATPVPPSAVVWVQDLDAPRPPPPHTYVAADWAPPPPPPSSPQSSLSVVARALAVVPMLAD